MTPTEQKLIVAGNALARSVGHKFGARCPKASPAVPCSCGAGVQQAQALGDWEHILEEIKGHLSGA